MPKFSVLLNLPLPPTHVWLAWPAIAAMMLGMFAAGIGSFMDILWGMGFAAVVFVGLSLWAIKDEKRFGSHDPLRQSYVAHFGRDSRQVRLFDEVQRGELRQAYKLGRVSLIIEHVGIFVITVIMATFMQVLFTDEPRTQAYIASALSLALLILLGAIVSRNPNLRLGYHTGFIFLALMQPDYTKAVRYADEMVRRNPTDAAILEAAHTYLVAGDIHRAEQLIIDLIPTLTAQATPRRRLERQRLSRALTIMSTIRIIG